MKVRHAVLVLALSLSAAPALAEDPPAGDEGGRPEDGAGQLQDGLEPGLEQRKPAEKPAAVDPDPALAERLEARRKELEQLVNQLQSDVNTPIDNLTPKDAKAYDKLAAASGKLVEGFIAQGEKYIEKRNTLLEEYRAAVDAGNNTNKDKAAKAIAKARADYQKELEKAATGAEKVRAELTKLQAKAKAE